MLEALQEDNDEERVSDGCLTPFFYKTKNSLFISKKIIMAKTYNIPIFDISVDEEGRGLFGLSFVDNPAIQVELHAFKAEGQKVYFSTHEKREVVSPVLIPNQLIIREAMGIPYYMRASEETIRKIYEKYMLSGNWNNFTYMHENMELDISERVQDGIYLQRLWIIEDEKNDDANTKYGFSLPKGTLMMKAKVQNRQIWNEIREKKIRGISLEALFDKVNSNKALQITYQKMKTNLELFSKFIAFLNEVSVEAEGVASEAVKDNTNSGIVELKYYIDDEHYFTVDGEGIVRDENLVPIEEGEYKLADGSVIVVGNGSRFVETKPIEGDINDETVEAPIAETFKEEEKEDEEDKKDDGESEGEAESDDAEPNTEDVPVDDDKYNGDGGEEKPKDDEELACDDKKEEKEEAPQVNAFPFEIEGTEYLLPEAVIKYIQSLQVSKIEVEEKLTQMEEQTPSAQPIGTVVKSTEEVSDINSRINALSMFKGFRH